MHATLLLTALAAAGPAIAWPGMAAGGSAAASHNNHARFHHGDMYKEIERAAAAQARDEDHARSIHQRDTDLLGDLVYLSEDELTDAGRAIKEILQGTLPATNGDAPPSKKAKRDVKKRSPCKPSKPETSSSVSALMSSSTASSSSATSSSATSGSATSSSATSSSATSSSATSSSVTSSSAMSSSSASATSATSSTSSTSSTSISSTSMSSPSSSAVPTTSSSSSSSTSSTSTSATSTPTPASCSVWKEIADAISPSFTDEKGCTSIARGAIRLPFHDSCAWNKTAAWGGADGSIVLSAEEQARPENAGLAPILAQMKTWYAQWEDKGVSMADLIQFAGAVATASCPLGPRVRFFAGRVDDDRAAVPDMLPSAFDDAPTLLTLFAAKGISAEELVALVGAHSTSRQYYTDTAVAGEPQDTTPAIWDSQFYWQTSEAQAPSGVYRFHSDVALANYDSTASTWNAMNNQATWNDAFASAYFRMSFLGVDNINDMIDCSDSVPWGWSSDTYNSGGYSGGY